MAGVFTHNGNIVEGLPSAANMINYDNTSSGMQATQLQAAVDELNTNKQPKTDNNLATTDKTVTGSINELKSGLTNVESKIDDATVYPYADVITIEDAVPSNLAECSVKIEPVQDLHGYDHPWVGGAGKNLFTGSDNTYTNDTAQTNVFAPTAVSKELTGAYYISFDYKVLESSTNNQALFYAMSNGSVVSGGNIFNFIDGNVSTNWIHMSGIMNRSVTFDAIYMFSNNKMTVKNVMVSATEGDFEPYTNICPISGHTDVDVQRDGKNLAGDFEEDKVIDYATGNITNNSNYHTTGWIIVKQGQKITVSGKGYGGERWFYNEDKTPNSQAGINDGTYTAPVNGFFRASVRKENTTLQIEYGSTATDYVPYLGKTYTIALGDTIYGGTVDFDSGVMTVDRKYIEFDGGETESWTSPQDRPHSFCHTENLGIADAWSGTDIKMISNQFTQNGEVAYYGSNYRIGYNATNGLFFVGFPSIDNVADFKTYLSNNHLQVVGILATPLTVQLTPQQIQLLKGNNTLTASTGQISVTVNGVSGSIGQVQEKVNDIAEDVAEVQSGLTTLGTRVNGIYTRTFYNDTTSTTLNNVYLPKTDKHTVAVIAGNDICTMVVSPSAIVEQNNIRNQVTVALNESNQFVVSGCPYYSRPMFIATYDFRQQPS